jgi:hypothetical protein
MRVQLIRIVSVLALVASLSLSSGAKADWFQPLENGWTTYVNERFGTILDYPSDLFVTEGAYDDGGFRFVSAEAALEVQAAENTSGETAADLRQRLLASGRYDEVTYQPSGSTWFVLSGYREDRIFYEKYIFRGGVVHAFAVEFPTAAKPVYAPMVERMEDSFGVDPHPVAVGPLSNVTVMPAEASVPRFAPEDEPPSSMLDRLPGAPEANTPDPVVVY